MMLTDIWLYSRHLFNRSLRWCDCDVVAEFPFTKRENGIVLTGKPYITARDVVEAGSLARTVRAKGKKATLPVSVSEDG